MHRLFRAPSTGEGKAVLVIFPLPHLPPGGREVLGLFSGCLPEDSLPRADSISLASPFLQLVGQLLPPAPEFTVHLWQDTLVIGCLYSV